MSAHPCRVLATIALAAAMTACASAPRVPPAAVAPRYPDFPMPDVPIALRAAAELRDRHDVAWRRLQAGDLRGASRDFSEILKRSAGFYPAETGLGYVLLADRDFKPAALRFSAALGQDNKYLPAWHGLTEAQLALGNDGEAIAALERIVVLDPTREAAKTRLELLRFRRVQAVIDGGRRARQAGKLDDAQAQLERALTLSPTSTVILRELAAVETERGALDAADAHARRAIQLDANDADAHAALGAVHEARGRYRDAATDYARAAAIDPKWHDRSENLREKADLAAVPAEFRALPAAASVTRAQLAAYIGTRLERLIANAPKRATAVATDVRTHWAAPWIVPVTQAGVMDISPNHTFQPNANVRRDHLAQIVSQLIGLATARPADLTRWKAAKPRFADLPGGNLYYPAAALAVSAGAMTLEDGDRFSPSRPASGPDVVAAVARIEQITAR